MNKHLSFFLLLFLFLSFSVHAEEQNFNSLINQGKTAFAAKDFDTAYTAFNQAFLLDPTNPGVSFSLGRAAFEKGDFETALMAFDRVLIMDPQAIRAKLEIARCHMNLGAHQTAKQYFYEVLSESPPDPVRENINIFLAAIAASEKRHFLTGMISLDLSFDDNAKTAPNAETLDFFGTPIPTDPAVEEEIVNTTLRATHIYKFEDSNFSWKTTVLNYNSFYTTYKDLDLILLGLTSGAVYQAKNYLLEVQGSFNDIQLAYDQYMRQTGAATSIAFPLAPQFIISASTGFSKKKYAQADDVDKDATSYTLSMNPTYLMGDNRFSFSISRERENADSVYSSYDRFRWSLRYDRFLPYDFSFYSSISIKGTDYDEIKPGEPSLRSDTVEDLSIGITKKLWHSEDNRKSVSLQARHTYTDSESTVPSYTYRKNITSTSLSYIF